MLETAKVDIRRLQLLNDRVNQTIDALNQLRLSVHGLQHTGMSTLGIGANVPQLGMQGVSGISQMSGVPGVIGQQGIGQSYGQSPFGQSPFSQFTQPYSQLGHSTFGGQGFGGVSPWGNVQQSPWSTMGNVGSMGNVGGIGNVSPFGVSSMVGTGQFGSINPYATGVGGLSHADISDPYIAYRVVQTFPYLFSPVSPVLQY